VLIVPPQQHGHDDRGLHDSELVADAFPRPTTEWQERKVRRNLTTRQRQDNRQGSDPPLGSPVRYPAITLCQFHVMCALIRR
jgi:hypothetical protein